MSDSQGGAVGALRRFVRRGARGSVASAERCELCAATLGADHPHLLATKDRRIACACAPCALLFADGANEPNGARGAGRFLGIPGRARSLPLILDDATFTALGVPIGLAFFVQRAGEEAPLAVYPSSGGPVESPLAADVWARLVERQPSVGALRVEVEALLVDRRRALAFAAPIDVCYRLCGVVRLHHRGVSGGPELDRALDAFFQELRGG
jgi:hypothetical protein